MRHQNDQRILAQKGRFARHVRPGDEPHPRRRCLFKARRPRFRPIIAKHAVVSDKRPLARRSQRLLHHRMPATADNQSAFGSDRRPYIVFHPRQVRQCRHAIKLGHRRGKPGQPRFLSTNCVGEFRKHLLFQRKRPLASRRDLTLDVAQRRCREAHRIRHRLAMSELGIQRCFHQRASRPGGRLQEIAKDIVMADLERLDPGFLDVGCLKVCQDFAAVVAHLPRSIQIRVRTGPDEPAIAPMDRRLVDKCIGKRGAQVWRSGLQRGLETREILRQARGTPSVIQQISNIAGHGDAITHGGQITRPAPLQRQPCDRAGNVRRPLHAHTQPIAQAVIPHQEADGIQPAIDRCGVHKRACDAGGKFTCTRPGDRAIHRCKQRSRAPARRSLDEFQACPAGRINHHGGIDPGASRRLQYRLLADLRQRHVAQQRAGCAEFTARKVAKCSKVANAQAVLKLHFARKAVEGLDRNVTDRCARPCGDVGNWVALSQNVGNQNFPRRETGNFTAQIRRGNFANFKLARRQIKRGKRDAWPAKIAALPGAAGPRRIGCLGPLENRDKVIARPRIKQCVFRQRPWRHETHNIALHDGLGPALFGLGRIFKLFANGDLEALPD